MRQLFCNNTVYCVVINSLPFTLCCCFSAFFNK
uniref:Uncharacterized protein n=1 Tax=Ciona intestinalis TaxID=7719 RepID=H2XND9_CIOIN